MFMFLSKSHTDVLKQIKQLWPDAFFSSFYFYYNLWVVVSLQDIKNIHDITNSVVDFVFFRYTVIGTL